MNRKERRKEQSITRTAGATPEIMEMFDRAYRHHEQGQIQQAAQIYSAILQQDPHHADSLHLLGLACLQNNDPNTAVELIGHAIRHEPRRPPYYLNYGNALVAQGRLEDALAQYTHLLTLDPKNSDAMNNVGSVHKQMFRLEEAEKHYRKAIAQNPGNYQAYDNLAQVQLTQGRREEALASMRRALEINPDYPEANLNYGDALSRDQPEEAIRYYKKAVALRPNYLQALCRLGIVHRQMGNKEEAIAAFREYLRHDPADLRCVSLPLAQLLGQQLPVRASDNYLLSTYTTRADTWDKALEAAAEYSAPRLAAEAVQKFYKGERPFTLLDAGCGTGLVGSLLRKDASRMVGIDLSAPMLKKAQDKKLYDSLMQGDLVALLANTQAQYDVVTCVATFLHFGDLSQALKACTNVLRQGGLLVFSTFYYDREDDPAGFAASQIEGSYMHSRSYIERVAKEAGFVVESIETPMHERDRYGNPITGVIAALEKL